MESEKSFDYWDFVAAETRRSDAPLYTQFAEGVAKDEELKALAHTVRAGQPPALVLFAAVHFLLLRGARHKLRNFYPNIDSATRVGLDGAFLAFKDFVGANRAELEPLIANRVTNTNEVARSAFLHAGFRVVAKEAGEPLHLVEIGPSAGLNLVWDRYGVRYLRGSESFAAGDSNAALVLETELRGDHVPPLGPAPRVASRVGLERDPVDLSSRDERDWLKALVWSDHVARFARLEKALEIYGAARPEICKGDALSLLPDALRAIPEHETACVYHSFVVYQFSEDMRAALDNLLIAVSLRRPIWRLSLEGTLSGETPLLLYYYRDGSREKRTLAFCHPHGAWIDWQG